MTRPTVKEVFEAIGFSIGNLRKKLPNLAQVRWWALRGVLVAAGGTVVYLAPLMPAIAPIGLWVLFSLGIFLAGAAAFCYVLFSFLMTLARVNPQVSNDVAHMVHKLANPLKTVATQAPTEGGFTPYDDYRGYLQEQFEELVQAGILNKTDNIDEVLGENKDFDFDAIKAKARSD